MAALEKLNNAVVDASKKFMGFMKELDEATNQEKFGSISVEDATRAVNSIADDLSGDLSTLTAKLANLVSKVRF